MPTIVEKTIGVGGDYPDVNTWWASTPADFVAADQIHRGLVLKQTITGSNTTLASRTTSATCYPELTAAPGASWVDDPSYGTAPLRLDKTKGATIEVTSASAGALVSTIKWMRVNRVQFNNPSNVASVASVLRVTGTDSLVDQVIVEGYGINSSAPGVFQVGNAGSEIKRSLIIQKATDVAALLGIVSNGGKATDCTMVSLGATLTAGIRTSALGATLTNCYVGGVANPQEATGTYNKTNCHTDGAATGWTTTPFNTANFVNLTIGTHDLRIRQGSTLDTANAGLQTPLYVPPSGDTTAPVLSAPAGSATGATTASISVATDDAGGLMYRYVTTASSGVTAAMIKSNGQSSTIEATGTQSYNVTGLAAQATYYAYFVQDDAASPPNTSNVVQSAAFTTPAADAVAPTFAGGAAITAGTITSSSVAGSYPAASDNVAVTGYEKSKDGGATWEDNGTGLTFQFSGLVANTGYPVRIRAYDAAGNRSALLSLTMTTLAAAGGSFKSSRLENNTGTVWAAGTTVHWEWRQSGRIGSAPASVTYGSSSVAGDFTVTAAGLPSGAGLLIAAVRGAAVVDDMVYYEVGTVA